MGPDNLVTFLMQVVLISLSGVIAPGPVTAATLASGMRSRHAGSLIAVGHGIVEFPLMLLVAAGAGTLLTSSVLATGIGLVGGAVLVLMGIGMVRNLRGSDIATVTPNGRSPVWTGVALTAGNPYFLVWWATVGLTLTTRALEIGMLAFGLFALLHWLCDMAWLEGLSLAAFSGVKLLGNGLQRTVLGICSVALIGLGGYFVIDALRRL